MKPVTIDPRMHDAVIFDLHSLIAGGDVSVGESAVTLARRLRETGVAVRFYSPAGRSEKLLGPDGIAESFNAGVTCAEADLVAAAAKFGVALERSVVIEGSAPGVEAARKGGFALVIGVDGGTDELLHSGADVVIADLASIEVRTGDKRMSRRPNALDSYGQLIGMVAGRQPLICLDFDGTLSEIVPDPDAATLVDGAAEALKQLAAQCPVAILSGRDLADIRGRVGVPGLWYAGSHGFELSGPDGSHHQNDAAADSVGVLESAAVDLGGALTLVPVVGF